MSEPDDVPAPAPARATVPQHRSGGAAIAGAIILGLLSFMSLLSTGCFGVFAFLMNRDQVNGLLLFCAIVMAAVTYGFFVWSRAVLKGTGRDQPPLRASAEQAEFKEGSDQ